VTQLRRGAWRGQAVLVGLFDRESATASTIFHQTRTPLTVWFAPPGTNSQKNDISAIGLQGELGIGLVQTVRSVQHRHHTAMSWSEGAGCRAVSKSMRPSSVV